MMRATNCAILMIPVDRGLVEHSEPTYGDIEWGVVSEKESVELYVDQGPSMGNIPNVMSSRCQMAFRCK